MKRLFDIVTLSSNHRRLNDPVTVITSGIAVLSQLFPNIFGGSRKRLTESDWMTLLPGAGYWTTSLRNYLQLHIHYDVDYPGNVLQFTKNFVYERPSELCGLSSWGTGTQSGNNFTKCYQNFLLKLQTEKNTGGNSPIGITPGGYGGTLDYSTLVPIAIGAVAIVLLMKSKKKKR
jgi:hypothetical protein